MLISCSWLGVYLSEQSLTSNVKCHPVGYVSWLLCRSIVLEGLEMFKDGVCFLWNPFEGSGEESSRDTCRFDFTSELWPLTGSIHCGSVC